jgi:glucose-1-phosphate thymidylyltransferase
MSIVGVIPAAGYATRLQPLECSKEVFPIAGRPVMEYALERLQAVREAEVRVVTRPEKRDVIELARRRGARVIEGYPPTQAQSFLLGMQGLDPDDVVLLDYPDALWQPRDGFVHLLDVFDGNTDAVLGLFDSSELDEGADEVTVDAHGWITKIEVRPPEPHSGPTWGCAVARARTLSALGAYTKPDDLFSELAVGGRLRGVRFQSPFIDVGTSPSLERAVALAERR